VGTRGKEAGKVEETGYRKGEETMGRMSGGLGMRRREGRERRPEAIYSSDAQRPADLMTLAFDRTSKASRIARGIRS